MWVVSEGRGTIDLHGCLGWRTCWLLDVDCSLNAKVKTGLRHCILHVASEPRQVAEGHVTAVQIGVFMCYLTLRYNKQEAVLAVSTVCLLLYLPSFNAPLCLSE